ncbi:DUF3667 domain-containing protein [Dysgonomonas macrotermitis]|uniref:DUF3667 domain-containing protein n=1 Tax=Dysgonomonas macrotermitis TaxID=1346286 RepID=A0A1M5F1C8_9BACT|nr:DUF3667 domain-containing protein [Dysgonomonas macrotermitis]SHF85188.1 Protein of unknown function [Dysgonomonas macrotermitis]
MSHAKIRAEKTCQNCGKYVAERFCPHCGQENTDINYTFLQLIHHFAADLFHYDSTFWITIKHLILSPGKLPKEYISGKRKSYVDPIKLYIFVSFITFFLYGILGTNSIQVDINATSDHTTEFTVNGTNKDTGKAIEIEISTIAQLDSISEIYNIPTDQYYSTKYAIKALSNILNKNKSEKIWEFITHNLTKVLFIYMPIFAFWVWIFHFRQRKYYSDSGIFTLYYFSFILLIMTFLNLLSFIMNKIGLIPFWDKIDSFLTLLYLAYIIWYFFKAHLYFFEEKKSISFLKSSIISAIAIILISVIMALFAMYALVAI